jgi:hypothetical protein
MYQAFFSASHFAPRALAWSFSAIGTFKSILLCTAVAFTGVEAFTGKSNIGELKFFCPGAATVDLMKKQGYLKKNPGSVCDAEPGPDTAG